MPPLLIWRFSLSSSLWHPRSLLRSIIHSNNFDILFNSLACQIGYNPLGTNFKQCFFVFLSWRENAFIWFSCINISVLIWYIEGTQEPGPSHNRGELFISSFIMLHHRGLSSPHLLIKNIHAMNQHVQRVIPFLFLWQCPRCQSLCNTAWKEFVF